MRSDRPHCPTPSPAVSVPAGSSNAAHCTPDWRPLLALVGELAHWFRWTGKAPLTRGLLADAYQHRQTGRQIAITVEGDCFIHAPAEPAGRAPWCPVTRRHALAHAFEGWHPLSRFDFEFAVQLDLLDRALESAERAELLPIDAAWLARQAANDAAIGECERRGSSGGASA